MTDQNSSHDISPITEYLFISSWPEGRHVEEISGLNIRLILSMHWIKPDAALNKTPLQLLWLPTFDNPVFKMPVHTLVKGVTAALPVIREGGGVLAHCRAGVHRSVAMACCVLIGMGMPADEAMQLVKSQRKAADPDIWYIQQRIRAFESAWLEQQATANG